MQSREGLLTRFKDESIVTFVSEIVMLAVVNGVFRKMTLKIACLVMLEMFTGPCYLMKILNTLDW